MKSTISFYHEMRKFHGKYPWKFCFQFWHLISMLDFESNQVQNLLGRVIFSRFFLCESFFFMMQFFVSKEVLWMKCKYSCRLCFLPRWYYNNLRVTGCFCKSRISLMGKFLLTNFHNHCGFCWMTQSVYWIDIKGEDYIGT